MSSETQALEQAKNLMRKASGVFVLTGAGISAESGVPTFRDPGGLWKKIDPYKVATPQAFSEDPEYVWKWYDERRTQLKECKPNPGHLALAELEKKKEYYFLLTQNVDDLHERAGSETISHVHGSIWEVRCTVEGTIMEDRRAPLPEIPPRCPQCGGLLRPNVVWFGEAIDADSIQATQTFLANSHIDVVFVVGTEASFGYISDWALSARGTQGHIIEINLGDTGFSSMADIHLRGPSGEILPQII